MIETVNKFDYSFGKIRLSFDAKNRLAGIKTNF